MTKIAFVLPYFGKFGNYFQLWLNSCKNNPTIDWIVLTDDHTDFVYPENVKVNYVTLDYVRERIERAFGMPVSLEDPYRLCNFKPLYGVIFDNLLEKYDFWGYCDCDLIWGDIRSFVTEDLLKKNDKIFQWGHCCLMRNEKRVNEFFKLPHPDVVDVAKVLKYPLSFAYDEASQCGKIFDMYFTTTYCKDVYNYDVFVPSLPFKPAPSMVGASCEKTIFSYIDGRIYGMTKKESELFTKEYMYVHLQKRKMKVLVAKSQSECDRYLIVPNKFIDYQDVTFENFSSFLPKCNFYLLKYKLFFEYYLDSVFDNKKTKSYVRGKMKRMFDRLLGRKPDC